MSPQVYTQTRWAREICFDYWTFLEQHTLFQSLGIVYEEDAPYPKMVPILSSLDLLNSWKHISSSVDPTVRDLMELLSRRVYIAAMLSLDREDLVKLHREAGQITVDPEEAADIEKTLLASLEEKRAKFEAAWMQWKETDFDVFDAIKNA